MNRAGQSESGTGSRARTFSFPEAIKAADELLSQLERLELTDAEAEQQLASMVASAEGARGFFVTYLTGRFSLSDNPPALLVRVLRQAPDLVCDLLAKNLVMSSTMALTHERNQDLESAQRSLTVCRRAQTLVGALARTEMDSRLAEMWRSVTEGRGEYTDFLKRWQYDEEQLARARQALELLIWPDSEGRCHGQG